MLWDLNKKSRQIHEAYEQKIHDRIEELGYDDTEWHDRFHTSSEHI